MKEIKPLNAEDLELLLAKRYCEPAYAFLPQVRSGTGFISNVRTADALAMSLWPSRGLDLHGFEIKVSRGDWLSELKKPEKAEQIAAFCDYWWIVTPNELGKTIMEKGELPANWGLLVARGNTLYQLKEPKKLQADPPDKLFLAAVLRKVVDYKTPDAKIKAADLAGYKRGFAEGNARNYDRQRLKQLEEALKAFEEKSGIQIGTYTSVGNAKEMAEAMKAVLNGEHKHILAKLEELPERVQRIEHYLRHTIAEMKGEKCCDEKPWI